jgi:asparagine synthase (glutamine-hydrolysing)
MDEHAHRSWLRDGVEQEFRSKVIDDKLTESLWWDRATRRHGYRRADRLGGYNFRRSAAMNGITYLIPFLDPLFLEALSNRGGRLGFPGRSAAMRTLFGGLLPQRFLERETKAEFLRTFVCRESRSFMVNWNGDGVDSDLVDIEALKREWEGERPHAGTLPLLQAAWLALET